MLSNRPRPMIGKLSELLVSENRPAAVDIGTSPRSPLDLKVQSPRGMKNYDIGGVGLGIVALLGKSSEDGKAKYCLCRSSSPRPINFCPKKYPTGFIDEVEDFDNSEDYTYVTCHGPEKTVTKVYYDGGHNDGASYLQVMGGFVRNNDMNVFKNFQETFLGDHAEYPTNDFLNCCHLCMKNLQGQDIYMYRGEKGFCSPECRSSQIMMDERKEQCKSSKASRSVDVSSSPYTSGQIFSTGILAA